MVFRLRLFFLDRELEEELVLLLELERDEEVPEELSARRAVAASILAV